MTDNVVRFEHHHSLRNTFQSVRATMSDNYIKNYKLFTMDIVII